MSANENNDKTIAVPTYMHNTVLLAFANVSEGRIVVQDINANPPSRGLLSKLETSQSKRPDDKTSLAISNDTMEFVIASSTPVTLGRGVARDATRTVSVLTCLFDDDEEEREYPGR